MRPWFERDPELLDRELKAFEDAGITAEIDEQLRAGGVIRMILGFPAPEGSIKLVASYPDFFPFFRPEVDAPDLKLTRHQNPMGGNLCLLGRRTSNWFAEETLAGVLTQQLPHLLDFHRTGDLEQLHSVEERQGEPASNYYNWCSVPDSYLLVDSDWSIDPAVRSGTFVARCAVLKDKNNGFEFLQGYVDRINDAEGLQIAGWTGPRPPQFSISIPGRWVRRDEAILGDLGEFQRVLGDEEWARLSNQSRRSVKRHIELGAVLFPEEVGQNQHSDGWAFICWNVQKMKKGRPQALRQAFLRSARAGLSDLAARMPAVAGLSEKVIVVVGLGAIGAPVAIELARSGAKQLKLVDGDRVEPSTVRRWPVGWSAFGRKKVEILKERLELDYPWTEIVPFDQMIGRANDLGEAQQRETVEDILAGADLIIDTSAELGVNHLFSELARVRQIPFLTASGTPGAWGGIVARFPPQGPCWMCLRHALYDTEAIGLPPADMNAEGETQPAGCAEPTFTGASFDLQEVSLEAIRAATALLGIGGSYLSEDFDVAVLSLRGEADRRIPPRWDVHHIPRRDDCSCNSSG